MTFFLKKKISDVTTEIINIEKNDNFFYNVKNIKMISLFYLYLLDTNFDLQ